MEQLALSLLAATSGSIPEILNIGYQKKYHAEKYK
jgi:hypothetical protein